MVEKITSFKSKQGKLFLREEAAIRSEVLESLCEIIPEFQMIRPRLEAQLDAIATAVGPILDFRRRVPSEGPLEFSTFSRSDKPRFGVCRGTQFSDQMFCEPCNLTWDMNDPAPPACTPVAEDTKDG